MIDRITSAYLEAIYLLNFQEETPDTQPAPITIIQASRRTSQFTRLADLIVPDWRGCWDDEQAGYDLYLSSAGHGTGFWDRSDPDSSCTQIGSVLDQIAKILGDPEPYLGDDGLIYFL